MSGPALLAAMILLHPCMLHGNLGGEFFRLLFPPETCSIIGTQKGRNEGKAEKDKSSTPLYRLFSLQLFSGRDGPAAVSAAAFKCFFVMSASLGAAAASTCALNSVDSGFGILGVQVHEEAFPLQMVLTHMQKEVLALELNGVLLLFVHYVSINEDHGVDAGKRPHIASKAEAEATPRVDVGEVSMTLVSRGERQNKPASFQVFARVDGKTLVVQVWEDMLISDLRALVACRLHASPDQCYVTKGGKLLSLLSSVHEVGLVKGSTVELHARGVGGAVPGEWYCNHCQRGGCWLARSHCFRCGMAWGDGGFGKGGKTKGKGGTPPRETSYPGKSSPTAARTQAGKGWSSKPSGENSIPVSISPDVVSQLLNLLQSLGVSQQVMGEIRTKTSQAFQKARVVPARTRRVAELEEKWLKSASHLENLREQMTRKEQDYIASMSRFEEHEKVVEKLEAEYREAKNLLVTPVPSVHSDGGSACEKEGSDGGVVSDMDVQNVEDVEELHDLDLISGDTCKGDPPPEPKRVRTEPPKTKAPPPISPSQNVDRDMLLAAIKRGVLSREDIAEAVNFNLQLALCSPSGPRVSG